MTEKDDERAARWEGHRYDAPESDETRQNKQWTYLVLGGLVVLLLVLIATGTVPLFGA
ncbi:MAG TPA: hypothetical protein VFY58_09165 [Nocardioides sp.]|nr:hypothetical protein [Nocardioides sp.]